MQKLSCRCHFMVLSLCLGRKQGDSNASGMSMSVEWWNHFFAGYKAV
jgi:hypothetical protein